MFGRLFLTDNNGIQIPYHRNIPFPAFYYNQTIVTALADEDSPH